MTTILLLIITIILWLDFYITHKKLVKKTIRDILKEIRWEKDTFSINKKWVWDKIIDELNKENKDFITKR
jgi:hypothetical protein